MSKLLRLHRREAGGIAIVVYLFYYRAPVNYIHFIMDLEHISKAFPPKAIFPAARFSLKCLSLEFARFHLRKFKIPFAVQASRSAGLFGDYTKINFKYR